MSQSQQCVPRSLHGLDLFEKKFKPIELTVDERFKMLREGAAVAGLQFFQPLAPVAAQRLISGYFLDTRKSSMPTSRISLGAFPIPN